MRAVAVAIGLGAVRRCCATVMCNGRAGLREAGKARSGTPCT
jgi:hypothetical protein